MIEAFNALPRFAFRNAYYDWAERQPGRNWERHGNQVVAIAPCEAQHDRIKALVRPALEAAILAAGISCTVLDCGIRVGVEEDSDYEPAAIITLDDPSACKPVVVIEVSTPSISYRDLNIRLADYFLLPSVRHCLVVMSAQRHILHHRLGRQGELLTSEHDNGLITLDPPGIEIQVASFYPDAFP